VTVLAWERGEVDTEIASWIDELAQPAAPTIPPDVEGAAPEVAMATGPLPPAVFDEDEPTHPRLGRSAPAPGAPVSPSAEPTRAAPAAETVLATPAPAAPSTLAAPVAAAEQVAEAAVPSAEPARDAPTTRRRPGAARTWSPEDAAQVAAAGTPPVAAGESVAAVEGAPAPVPAAATADRAESWVPGRLLLAVEDGSGAWEMDLHRHHGVMDLVLRGGDDLGLLVRDHWRELREALAAPGERPGEIRHELVVSATAAPDAGASGREGAEERGAFERWRSVIEAHDAAPVGRAPANLPADVGATRLVDRRL